MLRERTDSREREDRFGGHAPREGRPEDRFARARRHASRFLSLLGCSPAVARRYPRSGSVRVDTPAPPCLVHPVTAMHKDGSANAPQTTTSYGKAFASPSQPVVDVGMGYSRAHDCWRACSPDRRRDSREYGTMPHVSCPCWAAPPLWLGGIQDEVPSLVILRPNSSVHPVTVICKDSSANAPRTTTYTDKCLPLAPNPS